jgi:hypothetical protein
VINDTITIEISSIERLKLMNHPILAIEIGAGDLNLINNWVSQGNLKNLAKLLEGGASGTLLYNRNKLDNLFNWLYAENYWILGSFKVS